MAKKSNIFTRILQLVLDKSSVEKTKRETQDALKGATDPRAAEQNLDKLGTGFNKLKIIALGLATALVSGLALALRKVKNESIEAQKIAAQQEAVLRSTGQAAGRTAQQLEAQATALQKVTTFSDEAVASAQNLLLTFRHLREEEFDKAVEVTLDLATALGTDATTAALQLGKALEDPIAGLTALRRSGVSFSEAQRETIKTLVETNRLAEAQRMILAELDVQFGGSAVAARDTLGGALEGLKNAWGDLFEVSREGSSGVVRAINYIADQIPKLDRFLDVWLTRAGRAIDVLKELNRLAMTAPAEGVLLGAGMGGVVSSGAGRSWESDAAMMAARERQRLADLEEERQAQVELAQAEKARADAAARAHAEYQRAQEERIRFLIEAQKLGVATAGEEAQLEVVYSAIAATLQQGNLALEERIRLTKLAREVTDLWIGGRGGVTERDAGKALAFGRASLAPDGMGPIVAPDVTAQEEAAEKTSDAWKTAFQEIGAEAQIASGFMEAAFSGDGFLASLARVASAKVKENIARGIEVLAGGLAALVFGDPTKIGPAAEAAAGFGAAATAWGALGGAGGGGSSSLGGFGAANSTPAGRSADRMTQATTIHITQYIDGIDPKNGRHQEKVGKANIFYDQRTGGSR